MAAKRFHDDSENPEEKREKRLRALPSFSTVIREAMRAQQLQNFLAVLEPLVRRVVREEVREALESLLAGVGTTHTIQRSPQMQIEAINEPNLKLVFGTRVPSTIFTNNKVEDSENNPLQVFLVDTNDKQIPMPPLEVEVVVLEGDFQAEGHATSSEFDRRVVKERVGKRPLLTGAIKYKAEGGVCCISNVIITDNSSWVKSQKFRLGVRIAPGSYNGPRILEGITDAFRVKDNRGESYMKHELPRLTDKVWRLEKIGKDGAYRKRLSAANINTVQDFLMLWNVDAARLREIIDMSERAWETTLSHAMKCTLDVKSYTYHKQNFTIFLNSICQVTGIKIDGMDCSLQVLNMSQKAYVQEMVREAYENWNQFEANNGVIWHAALQQNDILEAAIQEEIEGLSSWDRSQIENPVFQLDGFDQVGTTSYCTDGFMDS